MFCSSLALDASGVLKKKKCKGEIYVGNVEHSPIPVNFGTNITR